MKALHCRCGNRVHFENTVCLACGEALLFDPLADEFVPAGDGNNVHPCAQRELIGCNWVAGTAGGLCIACESTRTIPDLSDPENVKRLSVVEMAKRRMLRSLIQLRLWDCKPSVTPQQQPVTANPVFDLLAPVQDGPPIMTGHAEGVITLNLTEADADERERVRDQLREPYRTVLGHFRHEVGHFYWDTLIKDSPWLTECRELFGDDSEDYAAALERHYSEGPPVGWQDHFISSYATAHAWEDWAETWAHLMHRQDTLESAMALGLAKPEHIFIDSEQISSLVGVAGADAAHANDFLQDTACWLDIAMKANELSRSMGQPDVYPFVASGPALKKLFFIERVIAAHGNASSTSAHLDAAGSELAHA
jgi:hypothetical protein